MQDPVDDSWQELAACRGADVELFYSTDDADVAAALAYCERCPVRDPCYDSAMSSRDPFGVWGGTPEAHRRRVFRATRRHRAA